MMTEDPQLLKKLIDDDEIEDVEFHPVKAPPLKKKMKSRKGCPCWCKCIGFTMLTFVFLGIMVMSWAYSVFTEVVEELTIETDHPQKFKIVTMSEEELDEVQSRVENFFDNVMEEKADIKDLVITEDEINGFVGHSDYLRGNLMITLGEHVIFEEFSLPMDIFGFQNRYFAGHDSIVLKNQVAQDGSYYYQKKNIIEMNFETTATHEDWFDGPLLFLQLQYLITMSKEDEGQKLFELFLEKGYFFGGWVSQEVIDERHNIMEDFHGEDCEEVLQKLANGIDSVSIERGKVVIKPRNSSSN